MLFNSVDFIIFFPTVTILYFILPFKFRWILLLMASCFFYMCFIPSYILILAVTIIVDYFAGIMIENSAGAKRKIILFVSIVSNVGFLAFFKYADFFIINYNSLVHFIGWNYSLNLLNILLPVGLSFHTFQAMSYTIEVFRGKHKAEKHFGIYSLYVMFYPQLVAGPIERPQNLLPQFKKKKTFNYHRVVSGLRLMLWGFFKKLVLADNLAIIVNQVYNNPDDQNSITYFLATFFFAFQIYADFSGYTDIARGAAKIMGFRLMRNFNIPYISTSIREFWQRWHISLSSWFRDYVYIPLGGNRSGKWKWARNILITFGISGLWHGANWTFIIWGLIHGSALLFERATRWYKENNNFIITLLKGLMTFFIVILAWVFFRASSLSQATNIISDILVSLPSDMSQLLRGVPMLLGFGQFGVNAIIKVLLLIVFVFSAEIIMANKKFQHKFSNSSAFRIALYYAVFYAIVFLGYYGEVQFIYFQF